MGSTDWTVVSSVESCMIRLPRGWLERPTWPSIGDLTVQKSRFSLSTPVRAPVFPVPLSRIFGSAKPSSSTPTSSPNQGPIELRLLVRRFANTLPYFAANAPDPEGTPVAAPIRAGPRGHARKQAFPDTSRQARL